MYAAAAVKDLDDEQNDSNAMIPRDDDAQTHRRRSPPRSLWDNVTLTLLGFMLTVSLALIILAAPANPAVTQKTTPADTSSVDAVRAAVIDQSRPFIELSNAASAAINGRFVGNSMQMIHCASCIEHYESIGKKVLSSVKTNALSTICPVTKDAYVCTGYCPFVDTKRLQKCDYLEQKHMPQLDSLADLYCQPPANQCPTNNAWLKDLLPPTLAEVRDIPPTLISNFTLGNKVPIDYSNFDYRGASIDSIAHNHDRVWTAEYIQKYRDRARKRETIGTYQTTELYPVLDAYEEIAIRGGSVAVLGTEQPWVEACLLEYGAVKVTTIEYGTIISKVPQVETLTPFEFANKAAQDFSLGKGVEQFDSIWVYSSLEHDGLGRYSDPINPDGDLQTMVKITCMLKPGGLLFLAVPASVEDLLSWNVHRLYGPLRIPFLIRYFHLVQIFHNVSRDRDWGHQPVMVLQNRIGCSNQ